LLAPVRVRPRVPKVDRLPVLLMLAVMLEAGQLMG